VTSEIFDPTAWDPVEGFDFTDITYHRSREIGAVRIAFNRPEVRNAFRPHTVDELYKALDDARMTSDVGAVLVTGNGPSPKDGGWAFCSGGDQRIRGSDGYKYEGAGSGDVASLGRLHILEVQRLIRFMPKIVIAVVPGWAVGGGHSLHVVCDLTLASREHAVFKQTDADVASFDGGYGSALLARQVGQKRAREVFFLGRAYSAQDAFEMGMVNAVVDHADLETVALEWAGEIVAKSPTSQRMLKYAFNLPDDGLVGQQLFAGEATRLAGRARRIPGEARPGLQHLPVALLDQLTADSPQPTARRLREGSGCQLSTVCCPLRRRRADRALSSSSPSGGGADGGGGGRRMPNRMRNLLTSPVIARRRCHPPVSLNPRFVRRQSTVLLSPRRNGGGTRGACDEKGTAWWRMQRSPARTFTQVINTANTSNPYPTMRSRR